MTRLGCSSAILKNKAEVLTLKVRPVAGGDEVPVAIAQDLLRRNRVYPIELAGRRFLVITSRQGANRVYALGSASVAFQSAAVDEGVVLDGDAGRWRVTESGLVAPGDTPVTLPRVTAQRAFWFGWRAQYPRTLLIR